MEGITDPPSVKLGTPLSKSAPFFAGEVLVTGREFRESDLGGNAANVGSKEVLIGLSTTGTKRDLE